MIKAKYFVTSYRVFNIGLQFDHEPSVHYRMTHSFPAEPLGSQDELIVYHHAPSSLSLLLLSTSSPLSQLKPNFMEEETKVCIKWSRSHD